jgi:hypothetical protein
MADATTIDRVVLWLRAAAGLTSQLSVECDVLTANGSANFSSLIAIPTG